MKNKLLFSLGALAAVAVALPMFAAFEAHVVNVTARIENALSVAPDELAFGTVFPQEHLDKDLNIKLSQSFVDEGRVDDISYKIKQKPKCVDNEDASKHPQVTEDAQGNFKCPQGSTMMPFLCPYLSKHSEIVSREPLTYEDGSLDSFHGPIDVAQWTDQVSETLAVKGHLAKSENDLQDNWKIDLAAPCFTKNCAQDWWDFVKSINPLVTNPDNYIQPIENEHKLFGCDLWVEVTGVSQGLDVSQCGVVQSPYPPTGQMLSPADYTYAGPDLGDITAGNASDHKWIQVVGSNRVVWDMGTPTQSVYLIPSIDHLPIPAESKESSLWGSDNPGGPWELGAEVQTYNNGPTPWISDDYTTKWSFTKPYKYVSATVGGTLQNDGDAEIDSVCSAK